MSPLFLALTVLLGIVAGFVNTLAGGGSLLTLPFLVFLGLDASVANATNRVAILLQNIVATWRFKKEGVVDLKEAAWLSAPAAVGAVVGTLIAVQIDEKLLQLAIALLISVMAVLLVTRPSMWESHEEKNIPVWLKCLLFFGIGVYGGFIQAGAGFLLIWTLAGVLGKDLVRTNGLKVTIVLFYTVISLGLFMSYGMVNYGYGLALAAGNMTGAALGTRFAVARGNRWLRYILAVVVILSALRMLLRALC
ncbi:MAG: sulfite exporter TauE/SafE family protein [Synergistota bacterium]|nr:sulfite exporter TauE/SafE family protein [Synergistota bacterium]